MKLKLYNFFCKFMAILYLTEIVCDFPPQFQRPFALTTEQQCLTPKAGPGEVKKDSDHMK
jgi:hypothetical protein